MRRINWFGDLIVATFATACLCACTGFHAAPGAAGLFPTALGEHTSISATAPRGEPQLADLFAGRARFQTLAEADILTLDFDGAVSAVWDEKLTTIENSSDGMIYGFARGYQADGRFKIYVMKSADGIHFKRSGAALFAQLGSDWTTYDPHVAVDTSVSPPRYVMTVECVSASFGASACISVSSTPWIPESWSQPTLIVQNDGAKSASTGAVLADNGNYYIKWSLVDDSAAAGTQSTSTYAAQLRNLTIRAGTSTSAGQVILPAETNTHCVSAWDCNNRDTQDWKREGDDYYMIYNGANYYRCQRDPADNATSQWGLAIRRSSQPLGSYEESSGILLSALPDNTCGISYPVINTIHGVHYLYFASVNAAGTINSAMRARLVWSDSAEKISQLYRSVLRRDPDSAGLSNWQTQLASGQSSIYGVRRALSTSSEASDLLDGLYQSLLRRAIDPGGLAHFQAELLGERTWDQIRAEIASSPEAGAAPVSVPAPPSPAPAAQADLITHYYQALLGRAPDASEVQGWQTRIIQQTLDGKGLARGFLNSSEFQSRYSAMTTAQKVDTLYQGLLHREPDSDGRASFSSAIDGGASAVQVFDGILNSTEFASVTAAYGLP